MFFINRKLFCIFAEQITYVFMKENLEIPTGTNKEDIKEREKIINDIYRKWSDNNPDKCIYNIDLQDFIYIRFDSINETVNKAARTYTSTLAVFHLTEILQNATVVRYERTKQNKNQSKYTQMIIMQWNNIKLTVGVKKDKMKIQYCITAMS